jgi:aryl-alcohol dehydrogenase-like predicted oxidoreductase
MRQLGNSNIYISPIGLGIWQFSNGGNFVGGYWESQSREQMRDIVAASVANGINWFDTAELYGNGVSEQNLARALEDAHIKPGEIIVASKWNPTFRCASSIGNTIQTRLDFLKPYALDLHQIHNPFSLSSVEKQANAMADLLDQGKIRSVGVSNFTVGMMVRADETLRQRGHSLVSNQMHYNLVTRGIERNGILKEAKDRGITLIAWSPLEQGLLTGRFQRDSASINKLPWMRRQRLKIQKSILTKTLPLIDAMERIGKNNNASIAQVALSWLIYANGDTVVAIPGASSVAQVAQNAAAMKLKLNEEEIRQLNEVSGKL